MPDGGTVIANVGDPGVAAIVDGQADMPRRRWSTVGLADGDAAAASAVHQPIAVTGRIIAEDPDGTTLQLDGLGAPDLDRSSRACRRPAGTTPPTHSAWPRPPRGSASPPEAIVRGLESFAGVGRRLERKGEAGGVVVYDDYGHHPTAIRATIAALRQREPGRRLWAVYEPLTYHRTAALASDFAACARNGGCGRDRRHLGRPRSGHDDRVGRGTSPPPWHDCGRAIPVAAPGSVDATAEWLAGEVRPGDAVLVMGGGHSYRIATGLLRRLEETA